MTLEAVVFEMKIISKTSTFLFRLPLSSVLCSMAHLFNLRRLRLFLVHLFRCSSVLSPIFVAQILACYGLSIE
jgi:hypothetical protein